VALLTALGLGFGSVSAGLFVSSKSKRERQLEAQKQAFDKKVQPLLSQFCYSCHGEKKKGDLDLRIYANAESAAKDRAVFEKVMKHLQAHEMPPENKPQPSPSERDTIVNWISTQFFPCDCDNPDPGRVTIRRLNRAEYNNTVRDLVGVRFQPARDFPADDSGYGFDNIGDVLSVSPVLLEKYLAAAESIMDEAILSGEATNGPVKRFPTDKLECSADSARFGTSGRILYREGEVFKTVSIPTSGEYILRARAFGQQAGPDPARMEFRLDGQALKVVDVKAVEAEPAIYETHLSLQPGDKRIGAAYINNYVNPKDPDPANRDRNLVIDYLELAGPIGPQPLPETHKRIFIRQPTPATKLECARDIVSAFARRAFRRPLRSEELDRLMTLFRSMDADGEGFENSIKFVLEAVLVSPDFLFRGETILPSKGERLARPIDEYALASRLAYFLWSSMPDEELFAQAEHKTLRHNLEAQVRRMLKDPKAAALAENFAGQWLQLRNLKLAAPDAKIFPEFNDALRASMQKETELFFDNILNGNRSILEFINADYTFVNEPLARLYGLNGVTGEQFRRVSLQGTRRGGLLTQASVLTITSNPTRTSPVKRGKWVLENILGTPPPPPPANVPELKEGKEAALTGTLRQRMEQHRADPNCASCHARMDPIGFSFENYNAIGVWRDKEGDMAIDPSGVLVGGDAFKSPDELKGLLSNKKREEFVRCLAEKMLTYALGRGLEYYDKCAVDRIVKNVAKAHYQFDTLILEVAQSVPFGMARAERPPSEVATDGGIGIGTGSGN
jgi:hypothetical protein